MEIEERQKKFDAEVKQSLPNDVHISPCYGTSNIARMIPGGIVLGVSNLVNYSGSRSLAIVSRICPLPNAEIYFAALIDHDKAQLADWLKEMKRLNGEGDSKYGDSNNNISIALSDKGEIFAYSKKISDLILPINPALGSPLKIDKFFFSVFCPNPSQEEKIVLDGILKILGQFVGPDSVNETETWPTLGIGPVPQKSDANLSKLVPAFQTALKVSGLVVSTETSSRFIASLLTKRFVILTGLSGSGKTRIADAVASFLSKSYSKQCLLVAVGADWSTNENLLGYPDALHPEKYVRPQSGVLDLILAASNDQKNPYFLILDEMNLSHVERYFSDFLSAMESDRDLRLHGESASLDGVPPSTSIPKNLFVIGTVNVDETTYMFSPKVLDRANVIEFRVRSDDIDSYLSNPGSIDVSKIESGGVAYSEAFVDVAKAFTISLSHLPLSLNAGESSSKIVTDDLSILFNLLAEEGAEYGFRTAHDIVRFICIHHLLEGSKWSVGNSIDAQILQKVLPKIHGSERRLKPLLAKLETFTDDRKYSTSLAKIRRMQARLRDGFTSFAEA